MLVDFGPRRPLLGPAPAAGTPGFAAPELVSPGAQPGHRRLLPGRHRVRAAHRRAAERHPPVVGGHRPRAGRPARGGHPRGPQHRPRQAARTPPGELVERLRAGWASRCRPACSRSASPTSWARPSVGGASRRHGAGPRGARRSRRGCGRAPRRPPPRGSGRGRLHGDGVPVARRGRPAPPSTREQPGHHDVARRPAARGPGRHPHRRDRPAPRRLRRPHPQHGRPAPRPRRRRRGPALADDGRARRATTSPTA